MNSRRFFKSVAAAILAVGVLTTGVSAPAQADGVISTKTPTSTTNDTGWGFK